MPTPVIAFNQVELSIYGTGAGQGVPTTDVAPVVAGIVSTGATWVRILADWKLIEGSPGVYTGPHRDALDAALTACTNAGLNVLLALADTPFWSPTPAAFADFATKMAQRYGPSGTYSLAIPLRHWEIWNEPNLFPSAAPGLTIPSMYAYQKAAYDAIKAVDAGAFVLPAGVAGAPNGFATTDAVTWMTGMYAAVPHGASPPWDGVASHPYSSTDNAGAQEPTATQVWIAQIPQLYQVMVKNGDGGKPLWLTEFGFATLPSGQASGVFVTPAVQAQWLIQQINTVTAVAAQAGVSLGPLFLYNYRNSLPDNGTGNGQNGMGVVNFDFTKKPAWAAVQSFISRGAPVGVTSGGTIIKPARPTITMSGTGPTGVTVGGTIIKPARPTITMSGTATPNVAATNWGRIGIALNPVAVPSDTFQGLADELTGVANSSLEQFAAALKAIADVANGAGQSANDAAGNFVALINGLVGGAAADIQALLASFSGTASTTLVNTNAIAALWAHNSAANTAGIHCTFNSSVPLTNNYQGTTNPAWTAAGPLLIPTVHSGKNYIESTAGTKAMVFTGNPNAAVSDHGLVTDRNQVYATLGELSFGTGALFMCGNFPSGTLLQNLMLQLGWGGPAALRFYVCTGANSGLTPVGTQYDLPRAPQLSDVIGMQHDGAGNLQMFFNNAPVGTPWVNGDGATLTFGAGHRDFGAIVSDNGFGSPTITFAEPVALDYV